MVAIAMVAQAVVVIVAAIGAAKARKQLDFDRGRDPRQGSAGHRRRAGHDAGAAAEVQVLTDNLVETSHVVRAKANEFDTTISEVNQRARAQTARVDDMVSSVLDTTAGIASGIQKSVQIPVREFNGIVNGIKAGLDVLTGRKGNHRPSVTYSDITERPGTNPFGSGAKRYRDEEPRL